MCTNSKNVRSEDQIKSWYLRDCRLHITGRHLTQVFLIVLSLHMVFKRRKLQRIKFRNPHAYCCVCFGFAFYKTAYAIYKKDYKDILTRKIGDYILK